MSLNVWLLIALDHRGSHRDQTDSQHWGNDWFEYYPAITPHKPSLNLLIYFFENEPFIFLMSTKI